MKWLWAYIRRKMTESLLAGMHDALTFGDDSTGLTEEQAAAALREFLGAPVPAEEDEATPSPPLLASPGANGTAGELPKRGPGRPRKFQEPAH